MLTVKGKIQAAVVFYGAMLLWCTNNSTGPSALDTTVIGTWRGAIGAIPMLHFTGDKIFLSVSRPDSSFRLITRDTTRAAVQVIKDTMVVLTGAWRINGSKDSILLLCDSCRVVDTALNVLSQRNVKGQVIPVGLTIDKQSSGLILWHVRLSDLAPLIPFIGIDLSSISPDVLRTLLSGTLIALEKTSH